jgi:hypothetical protein
MGKDLDKKLVYWLIGVVAVFAWLGGCAGMAVRMSPAERLYRAKCSSCHNVIMPGAHSEQLWRAHIEEYGRHLTDDEKQTILQYVTPAD